MKHRTRTTRAIIACLMALCLVLSVFSISTLSDSYAASSFTSKSVFDGNTYTHNGDFAGNLIVNGVDASVYQSTSSNWTTAKKNGVDYAILRVTWTGYSKTTFSYEHHDSNFASHYSKAKAAGQMVGVYVFSQAKTVAEAKKEANYAIARLQSLGIDPEDLDLPIYMDYEFAGGTNGRLYNALTKSLATKCAKAFCDVVRDAGYQPGIYASKSFYDSYITHDSLGDDVDFWVAQYNSKNTYTSSYSKWQYSSSAKIGGLLNSSGSVGSTDVNFWYVNIDTPGTGTLDIYGSQNVKYTGSAVLPNLQIYDGDTLLEEGTDYTINGITNVSKGTAYAYIRGIGNYSGYAVVPFNIGSDYVAKTSLASGVTITNAYESIDTLLVRYINEGKEVSSSYVDKGTKVVNLETPDDPTKADDENYTYEFNGWALADHSSVAKVEEALTFVATYKKISKSDSTVSVEVDETVPETSKAEASTRQVVSGNYNIYKADDLTWIGGVSDGTTADELLSGLSVSESSVSGLTMKIIDSYGDDVDGEVSVETGMMVAVYKGNTLQGTAVILVDGDTLNSVSADYIE